MYATLSKRHGENFHERSLIICSGLDMVNISCTNIIAKDVKTAQVDIERKKKQSKNYLEIHFVLLRYLYKEISS